MNSTKQEAIKRFKDVCSAGLQFKYPNQFDVTSFEVDDAKGRVRVSMIETAQLLQAGKKMGLIMVFDFVDLSKESSGMKCIEPEEFVLSEAEYSELVDLFCETEKTKQLILADKKQKQKELFISFAVSFLVSVIWFSIYWFVIMPMPKIDGTHGGVWDCIWSSIVLFFGALVVCRIAYSGGSSGFYSGDMDGFPYGAF